MGRESIREYQLYRLQRLLLRARRDVPYWREVIGTRLLRGDSLDIGEFAHLPILTRETLRNRHREFIIKNLDRYKHRTFVTSGSTDVPKKFVADKPFCQKIMAVEACYVRRFGVKDYRQFGFFLNKPHLADLTTQIDPFTSNAEELNKIFMEKDIRAVGGAVYRLLRLAEMVESGKVRVNLTFVLAGSEYLSPERKRYFEKVFRCPVYNKYVCAEAGMIGVECTESGGFHIDPVNTYVEIVDENGVPITDGRSGRIVITVFNNRLMPLIRYELGDTGKWVDETKSCGCGLKTPRLHFDGRTLDYLKFADGRTYPALKFIRGIDQKFSRFMLKRQLIQESYEKISLKFVPAPPCRPRTKERIRDFILRDRLRDFPNVTVEVEAVEHLDNVESGKHVTFVSRLPKDIPS